MKPTELCIIMAECGSDKGDINILQSWHNYTLLYDNLFKNIRNEKLRVFELGLGTNNPNIPSNMCWYKKCVPGASLYGWEKYFKNASIYGADIDRAILFNSGRIKTYYCDQTKKEEIDSLWKEEELDEGFNIMIDDGLHEFDANVCFFENSIHKLKEGGIYIIEDIIPSALLKWEEKLVEYREKYKYLDFKIVKLPNMINKNDNNLIVIKFNLSNWF